ncbi:hypothetical protein AVEN_13565-1 [Araneus ventricosus]|uniref:Uncharacterized protein n=1 Tax=Araneus ventricosus TaxID=182803 RepID=A0A4Y2D5F1_ARAVE|nr:hypothetical protein AVEN_13565-1 [Araneus ventricosus]
MILSQFVAYENPFNLNKIRTTAAPPTRADGRQGLALSLPSLSTRRWPIFSKLRPLGTSTTLNAGAQSCTVSDPLEKTSKWLQVQTDDDTPRNKMYHLSKGSYARPTSGVYCCHGFKQTRAASASHGAPSRGRKGKQKLKRRKN